MSGEVIRVLTVAGSCGREQYERSLFPQADAQRGSCTTHATIYTANLAAGMMLHQFTRWLRDIAISSDVAVNLLAYEMTALSSDPA